MTRLLALDWDHDRCYLLAGTLAKDGVRIERALVWSEPELLSSQNAEVLGKKLREFLKSADVAPAPLLACVPRERILLKEIRYPTVSAQDEPALVRFQAAKDIVEAGDEIVLDYSRQSQTAGESRALVAVLRRDIVAGYQAMCKEAGLKLLALTARPFAMAGCLLHSQGPAAAPTVSAVLWIGSTRAELTILRGATVLFSRPLDVEPSLEADVRRSLTIFSSQESGNVPQTLYLIGKLPTDSTLGAGLSPPNALGAGLLTPSNLHAGLNLNVVHLRFFPENDRQDANYASALGLLQTWTQEQVPVNFVRPKEPRVAAPVNRSRLVVAGGLAFLTLVGVVFWCASVLADKRGEIQKAVDGKAKTEEQLKEMAQDKTDLEALKEWDRSTVAWLDELHNLTARLPNQVGFHLSKAQAEPLPRKGKEKLVARLSLTGVTPPGKDNLVYQYLDALRDEHAQGRIERFKGGSAQEFALKLDLQKLPSSSPLAGEVRGGGRGAP